MRLALLMLVIGAFSIGTLLLGAEGVPQPIVYPFRVSARDHTTKSPLRTGIMLRSGQRILIEPNPTDTWHDGNSAPINFKGRASKKGPRMWLEWGMGKPEGQVKDEHFQITAPREGELTLNCADGKAAKNNTGVIRVSVTVYPITK